MNDRAERLSTLVTSIVKSLVDHEDSVAVRLDRVEALCMFVVQCHPQDFGKVIGRRGANAHALRVLVRGAGRKLKLDAYLKVIDPQGREYRVPDPEWAPVGVEPGSKPPGSAQ
jgi:hypothetical protein